MKISVEVFNPKKTFKRIFSDDVRKYAHTRLHAYCSPYVPMTVCTGPDGRYHP